jgi:GNAT superfamily N-acetyltransferase
MMLMKFSTINHWDEAVWDQAERVYYQAFPIHGRKTREIIRTILDKQLGCIHIATDDTETVVAMALTGKLEGIDALLIDYLAVREDLRSQGTGQLFMDYICNWAVTIEACVGIVIEIESDITPTNLRRLRFWEKYGFILTEYIHTYIWVTEPYRALYLQLDPALKLPEDGETLFQHITQFHRKAYTGK